MAAARKGLIGFGLGVDIAYYAAATCVVDATARGE